MQTNEPPNLQSKEEVRKPTATFDAPFHAQNAMPERGSCALEDADFINRPENQRPLLQPWISDYLAYLHRRCVGLAVQS